MADIETLVCDVYLLIKRLAGNCLSGDVIRTQYSQSDWSRFESIATANRQVCNSRLYRRNCYFIRDGEWPNLLLVQDLTAQCEYGVACGAPHRYLQCRSGPYIDTGLHTNN